MCERIAYNYECARVCVNNVGALQPLEGAHIAHSTQHGCEADRSAVRLPVWCVSLTATATATATTTTGDRLDKQRLMLG